jgi:hypothetical protein
VELINDQFYVLDGYDFRPSGDPLEYAVFVLDVLETGNQAPVVDAGAGAGFESDAGFDPGLAMMTTSS